MAEHIRYQEYVEFPFNIFAEKLAKNITDKLAEPISTEEKIEGLTSFLVEKTIELEDEGVIDRDAIVHRGAYVWDIESEEDVLVETPLLGIYRGVSFSNNESLEDSESKFSVHHEVEVYGPHNVNNPDEFESHIVQVPVEQLKVDVLTNTSLTSTSDQQLELIRSFLTISGTEQRIEALAQYFSQFYCIPKLPGQPKHHNIDVFLDEVNMLLPYAGTDVTVYAQDALLHVDPLKDKAKGFTIDELQEGFSGKFIGFAPMPAYVKVFEDDGSVSYVVNYKKANYKNLGLCLSYQHEDMSYLLQIPAHRFVDIFVNSEDDEEQYFDPSDDASDQDDI
jgi:hypothetical protein